MQEDETNYQNYEYIDPNIKLRDLEEKQRVLKDRIILIGQNMIETKEENAEKILELKKDVEILKESMERIKSFLQTIANELSKFARKDELEILSKQVKMFEPLNLK